MTWGLLANAAALLMPVAALAAPSARPVAAAPVGARWTQLVDTVFHHITPAQGLPNTIATAFAEDGQGFIWVGTQSGLSRWDGYRFKTYQPEAGDAGSLPNPLVQTLRVDGAGRLWVGTSGGLARYDANADRFVRYAAGEQRLASPSVLSLADDGAGGLWVGTAGGLDHLNTGNGVVTHTPPTVAGGLPTGRIAVVLRDRKGTLWTGTQNGLYRRVGTSPFATVPLALAAGEVAGVERLLEDAAGTLWIGTRRHGVFRLDTGAAQAQAVQSSTPGAASLAGENIGSLVEATPGTIWVGTFGSGIVVVDAATGHTRSVRRDRTLPPTLADDNVWGLLRDRSGLVWAGSNRGVSVHSPAQSALATVFADTSRNGGVTDSEIFAVATASDGRVWLGLGTNGVDILDPHGARAAQLRPGPGPAHSTLPKDRIWSIAAAPDGTVYLGTNRGLYRSDVNASRVERLTLAGRNVVENTQTLLLDGGTLFLGGTAGGLWALDRTTGNARQIGASALANQRIISLAKGAAAAGRQKIWAASASNLYAVELETDTHGVPTERVIPLAANDAAAVDAGLSGITSLLVEASGRMWIGTDAGDLQMLDANVSPGSMAKLQRVRALGPHSRGIDKLLQDPTGTVWASTDGGLITVNPKRWPSVLSTVPMVMHSPQVIGRIPAP